MSKWNKDSIASEIMRRHDAGLDLSYSGMTREDLPLLRAASRYHGSWEQAITFAGLNYDDIRRYRSWTNDRIIERLKELFARGEDLSWRYVSTKLDPGLAAAATKKSHFGTWRAALSAAGIDYDAVRRYRDWSEEEVIRQVRDLYARGAALNAKSLEGEDIALITAARRRFPSWDRTLTAAGLNYQDIVLRAPFQRRRTAAGEDTASQTPPPRPRLRRTPKA